MTNTEFLSARDELNGTLEILNLDKTLTAMLIMCVYASRQEVLDHFYSSGQFDLPHISVDTAVLCLRYMIATHAMGQH